jgi:hypothetical protein
VSGGGGNVVVAAQATADGSSFVVRLANTGNTTQVVQVSLTGGAFHLGGSGSVWTLSGGLGDENTPAAPMAVSPVKAAAPISSPTSATVTLPAFSFVVAQYPRTA